MKSHLSRNQPFEKVGQVKDDYACRGGPLRCSFPGPSVRYCRAAAILTVPGSSPSIQGAINLAGSGDEVLVSPGTYTEAISSLGKNITVRSVGGPAATTITVTSRTPVVQFINGEGHGAVLDGFTLTGGRPSGDLPFNGDGGGVFVSFAAPTIPSGGNAAEAEFAGLGPEARCRQQPT